MGKLQQVPSVETVLRFLSFVRDTKKGQCWLWKGHKTKAGYGQFGIGRQVFYAHRVALAWRTHKVPQGLVVDHLCRNPPCVNPDHLEWVTNSINNRRGAMGGRVRCKKYGHPIAFGHKNTYVDINGKRQCRECHRIESLKRYHRRKQ